MCLVPRRGIPIVADQVETRSRGQSPPSSRESLVARDSAGRLRLSHTNCDSVFDPVEGRRLVILADSRVAYRTPWTKFPNVPVDAMPGALLVPQNSSGSEPLLETEQLGQQSIEGIECSGTRVVRTDQQTRVMLEEWSNRELGLIVVLTMSDGEENYSLRLCNIRRGEPDASLFTIPSGYMITDLMA